MVEVNVFTEPFNTSVVLASGLEGLVDGVQVLVATHLANPSVGSIKSWFIGQIDTHGQPTLSDLGVHIISAVVISINLSQNSDISALSRVQGSVEDNLLI